MSSPLAINQVVRDGLDDRSMALHPAVEARLARLAPDQRAAATAPAGPSLCIAPAGSGKTTTLVARAAWLIATGTPPEAIRAITFNKRAAVEMTERLDAAVAPLGVAPGGVRVRTFHALGREILREAGVVVEPMADRAAVLAEVAPWADEAARLRLILQAIERLEHDPALLARWRARCGELLVDEVQDVDRAQLRLALLLAAPDNRIFLVGDDDQSIYGWRLADVRRLLGLEALLPRLRRVDLEVNYRCPRTVVERAIRLVEHNGERFTKAIRPGPAAAGRLVLAPDAADETVRLERAVRTWPDDGTTRAVLARTNRELLPAVVVALRLEMPFRAPRIELLLDSPVVDRVLERAAAAADPREPLLVTLGRVRASVADDPAAAEIATALLGWAIGHADLTALIAAIEETRTRLAELRRDDAPLTLATAHATKGLEFDHVIVVGMEIGRFPSARAVSHAEDPARAYEEERRLAYVAWTRARQSLTLLYDPAVPSPFLLEAFGADELGLSPAPG
jgi:DNA helicase-2/ATP-dependent DNA helicase PcrA